MANVLDKANEAAARLESRAETIRTVITAIRRDPILAEELREILQVDASTKPQARKKHRTDAGTNNDSRVPNSVQRIFDLFKSINNNWLTVNEIAERGHIPKNSIPVVLYERGKQYFESRSNPNEPRGKQWRLKIS